MGPLSLISFSSLCLLICLATTGAVDHSISWSLAPSPRDLVAHVGDVLHFNLTNASRTVVYCGGGDKGLALASGCMCDHVDQPNFQKTSTTWKFELPHLPGNVTHHFVSSVHSACMQDMRFSVLLQTNEPCDQAQAVTYLCENNTVMVAEYRSHECVGNPVNKKTAVDVESGPKVSPGCHKWEHLYITGLSCNGDQLMGGMLYTDDSCSMASNVTISEHLSTCFENECEFFFDDHESNDDSESHSDFESHSDSEIHSDSESHSDTESHDKVEGGWGNDDGSDSNSDSGCSSGTHSKIFCSGDTPMRRMFSPDLDQCDGAGIGDIVEDDTCKMIATGSDAIVYEKLACVDGSPRMVGYLGPLCTGVKQYSYPEAAMASNFDCFSSCMDLEEVFWQPARSMLPSCAADCTGFQSSYQSHHLASTCSFMKNASGSECLMPCTEQADLATLNEVLAICHLGSYPQPQATVQFVSTWPLLEVETAMTRAWQLQFKGSVANASSLPMHAVTIQSVVAGSAVVNCSVEFPSNQTAHSFRQLVAEDMFSAEFLEQAGSPSLVFDEVVTTSTHPPTSSPTPMPTPSPTSSPTSPPTSSPTSSTTSAMMPPSNNANTTMLPPSPDESRAGYLYQPMGAVGATLMLICTCLLG